MQLLLILLAFLIIFSVIGEIIEVPLVHYSVHKDVLKARQKNRVSKLIETPYKNEYVTANISLGDSTSVFEVVLSSRSSKLWVIRNTFSPKGRGQNGYDPDNSTTSVNLENPFSEYDGSFGFTGQLYADNFYFGTAQITNQTFGVISGISGSETFPFAGVFGFNHLIEAAYTENNEYPAPIDNLMGLLVQKKITVYLGKQVPPSIGVSGGKITIGGFDSEHCDANKGIKPYQFVDSNADNQRYFSINGMSYDEYTNEQAGTASLDISVSTLVMPLNYVQAIFKYINVTYNWEYGVYTTSCNQTNIQAIKFDDGNIVINASEFIVDLDIGPNECAVAIEVNSNQWQEDYTFGTPMARQYCWLYDFEQNTIQPIMHKS